MGRGRGEPPLTASRFLQPNRIQPDGERLRAHPAQQEEAPSREPLQAASPARRDHPQAAHTAEHASAGPGRNAAGARRVHQTHEEIRQNGGTGVAPSPHASLHEHRTHHARLGGTDARASHPHRASGGSGH